MQGARRVERNTLYYYLAARLIESGNNGQKETREISRRCKQRKTINLLDLSETEFKNRFRLSKEAFIFLCDKLSRDTSLKSTKRINLELKVLCALSFYATGSYQRLVGMAKNLGQTTVSKYVREVTDALITPAVMNSYIKFPDTREQRELIKNQPMFFLNFCKQHTYLHLVNVVIELYEGTTQSNRVWARFGKDFDPRFYSKFGFPGVIGCIDGCHFHVFTPKKDIEHLFYCRKHFHSINVQMICDSDCRILNMNAKYGGATHDAFIWENSVANNYMQELHRHNEQVWLLGDCGYPQRPWLMTPIPDAVEGSPEAKYTNVHGKTRVTIENTFGRLKNRWRCLCKDRTLHYSPEKCAKIIMACSVLHNLAKDFNVPEPEGHLTTEPSIISGNIFQDSDTGDDLARGRALRNVLVDRINRLHI